MKLKILKNNVLSILALLVLFLAILALPVSAESGSLTGILKDKYTNKPISGTIVAHNVDNDYSIPCNVGADGVYKFDDLPAGKYTITISADGYKKITVDKEIVQGANVLYPNDDKNKETSDVNMVSTEPGSIEVTINDKFSNPIEGAIVYVTGDMSKTGTTDSNGKCTIDGLVAGTYTVTAVKTTDGRDFTGTLDVTVDPGKKTVSDTIKVGSQSDSNPSSKSDSSSETSSQNPSSNPSSSSETSSQNPSSNPSSSSETSSQNPRPNEGIVMEVIDHNAYNAEYAIELRPVDIATENTISGATLELTDDSQKHIKSIIRQDAEGWFLVKNKIQDPISGYDTGDYEGVITAPGYKPYKETIYIYDNWNTRGTPQLTKTPLDVGFFTTIKNKLGSMAGSIVDGIESMIGIGSKKEVITPPGGGSGV